MTEATFKVVDRAWCCPHRAQASLLMPDGLCTCSVWCCIETVEAVISSFEFRSWRLHAKAAVCMAHNGLWPPCLPTQHVHHRMYLSLASTDSARSFPLPSDKGKIVFLHPSTPFELDRRVFLEPNTKRAWVLLAASAKSWTSNHNVHVG